ncbi:PAS domain S-box protein [Azospirillum sp. sgz302134]
MFVAWGPELTFLYNDVYAPIFGAKHPGALGRPFAAVWADIWEQIQPLVDRTLAGEASWHEDLLIPMERRGYREQAWFTFSYTPVQDDQGRIAGMFCAASETTEHVQAKHRTAFHLELESRLRTLSDPLEVAMAAEEALGRHLGASRVGYGVMDETERYFTTDRNWTDGTVAGHVGTHDLAAFGPAILATLRRGEPLVVDDAAADPRTNTPDRLAAFAALEFTSVVTASLVKNGRMVAALYVHDRRPRRWRPDEVQLVEEVAARTWSAVERARAEASLRDFAATLEKRVAERTADRDRMWRLSTDVMLVARFDATMTAVNPAWTNLLGWTEEELVGTSFLDLVHPDDREVTAAEAGRLASGLTTLRFENRYRHKDGSYRWISWIAVPDERFIHAVGRDISAQKEADSALRQAEDQLRQAQKMEAMGQLTGGMAHDFNNLLQAMGGCLAMIARRTDEPKVKPLLDAGQQAVGRGAKLVQQLMAFARRDSLRPEPIDVRDRLLGMSALLERALRADIRLETRFGAGLWPVEADPTQFELAVINLAVNARDAMPTGGRLAIEAENVTLPPGNPRGVIGDFLRLSVTDTGSGMPSDVAARAFEPFFTTKETGKGTGLGLAQVYGLARQAGGTAWIDSAPGRGTTVNLLLRRSRAVPAAALAPGFAAPAEGATRGGRVLVVEDDPIVAMTVSTALEDVGFAVTCVTTADEALPILAAGDVDVLFSDVVMPGSMSGVDLAREAQRRFPGLPVILATGYSEDIARADGIQVLSKPYRIDDLVRRLDAALEAERAQ